MKSVGARDNVLYRDRGRMRAGRLPLRGCQRKEMLSCADVSVKSVVNPDNPTPRGWGYQLPNPENNGKPVYFDDCQQSTGMMIEAKGNYAGVLSFEPSLSKISADWLDQSAAQIAAAGGRPIRWYFAEPETRAFAEELFKSAGGGRDRIETQVLPWPGSAP